MLSPPNLAQLRASNHKTAQHPGLPAQLVLLVEGGGLIGSQNNQPALTQTEMLSAVVQLSVATLVHVITGKFTHKDVHTVNLIADSHE